MMYPSERDWDILIRLVVSLMVVGVFAIIAAVIWLAMWVIEHVSITIQ